MDEIDTIYSNQEQKKPKYHKCPTCGMYQFTETCPFCSWKEKEGE